MSPLPPLGVFAKPAGATGDYQSIATVTVGSGGSSTVSFSSIPATFTHLQIRGIVLGSAAASGSTSFQVNGDTGSNYANHLLTGSGSAAAAWGNASATYGRIHGYSTNVSNNSYPVAFVMDILDYANANKYKTFRILSGLDQNGSGEIDLYSNLWMSTSAITSFSIYIGGQNIAQYSHFALYGIKGA